MHTKINIGIFTGITSIDRFIAGALPEKKYSYTILSSKSTNILIEMINQNVACIFLKTGLKNIDVRKICNNIKKNRSLKNIKIVLLSSEDQIAEITAQYGANLFIKLPMRSSDIKNTLDKLFIDQKKILYVDNDVLYHQSVVPRIKIKGRTVHSFYNGLEAWKYLQKHLVDLVVTDTEMPIMNGYELCEKIKKDTRLRNTSVILTTTSQTEASIIRGFSIGADGYLIKPFDISELVSRINNFIFGVKVTRKEKILIVENDLVAGERMKQIFEKNYLYSDIAENCDIALNKLKNEVFFLIITALPVLDGAKFVLEVRKNNILYDIPIVVLSKNKNILDMIKMQSLGVQVFLSPPFSSDRLLVEVEKCIAETKLLKEHKIMQRYLTNEAIEAVKLGAISNQYKTTVENSFRTILFIDIENFTVLCEKLSAREVVSILNTYFDIMVEVLVRYGASIDKFIGDAIMALFDDEEVGAYKAVHAAREMIASLDQVHKETNKDIHMRIGINSGHVILGDIGSHRSRRDHTAIGDNVNIASRLERNADRDQVLISETTYKIVKEYVNATEKILNLKGKVGLFKTYQINSIKAQDDLLM